MANEFGAYHIADNPELYEPARVNNYQLIITGIDSLLKAGVDEATAQETDYFKNAQEVIRVSVESTAVPSFDINVLEVKRGNSVTKFAGTPTFSESDIKLVDYMGAKTRDIMYAWQALAYDVRSEKISKSTKYKKDCILVEYSPDYNEVLRTITLKGCWVSSVKADDFDNNSDDIRKVEATLVYDKFIVE